MGFRALGLLSQIPNHNLGSRRAGVSSRVPQYVFEFFWQRPMPLGRDLLIEIEKVTTLVE